MLKQKSILKFEIISTIFILILGTLLHFTFDWSNSNFFVGTFSPVNESIWEHLKLLFFPMVITIIAGYFYEGKNIESYLCAKTFGIIISMLFTIIAYYTYSGVIGKNIDVINIIIFILAVIIGQYVSYKKLKSKFYCNNLVAIIILVIIYLYFLVFTFYSPQIGLFKDPVTGTFGIYKK